MSRPIALASSVTSPIVTSPDEVFSRAQSLGAVEDNLTQATDDANRETVCSYRAAADYLLAARPDECHPALYAQRFEMSRKLYIASGNPVNEHNRSLLAGVKFLCYCLPGQ